MCTMMGQPPELFPSPKGQFLLGHLNYVKSDGMDYFHQTACSEGLHFKLNLLGFPLYFVCDPESIEQVLTKKAANYPKRRSIKPLKELLNNGLVTSDGTQWQTDRKALQNIFNTSLASFQESTTLILDKKIEQLKKVPPDKPLAVYDIFFEITYEIIQHFFLPEPTQEYVLEQIDADIKLIVQFLFRRSEFPDFLIPIGTPLPFYRKARAAIDRFDALIFNEIKAIKSGKVKHKNGFLNVLCQIPHFSIKDIRDQTFTFLLAGHETTLLTLHNFWYAMNLNPLKAKMVVEEIRSTSTSCVKNIREIPYTYAMLNETFRCFPPITLIARDSVHSDTLGGYHLPKNSIIILPISSIHRHPDLWETPEMFKPERFLNKDENAYRYRFLPFSDGPRFCIGKQFALSELSMIISSFLHHFDWKPSSDNNISFEKTGFLSRPKRSLLFTLSKP